MHVRGLAAPRGLGGNGISKNGKKIPWTPLRLEKVGSISELVALTTTGSKRDSAMGCGTTRRRTVAGGIPC